MKTLKTLIRFHRRELDQIRRELADLERQRERLLEASARIAQELQAEMDFAAGLPAMGHFFGGFAKRIQERQEKLAEAVAKVDVQILDAREKLFVKFSEVKTYEIALKNAQKRAQEEADRRERIRYDEIAITQFARRGEEHAQH